MAGIEPMVVHMKGTRERNRDEQSTFESSGGSVPYLWIGDSTGCFTAVTDLRTLRKMKVVLDAIIDKRDRKS